MRCSLFGLLVFASVLVPSARAELRVGAAVVDVTPAVLPVLVNGGMFTRSVDRVNTRVHARAIALDDGRERVVLVVVDSCMMGRSLLDEAKALVSRSTGIATNRILISATHAHSAPSSMGCLGTDADPRYVPLLRDRLVEVVRQARENLEPARVGWARAHAPEYTALRQWIRRPDRLAEDPFGNKTVRANMHAGANWDDVTGEAGPEDPDLTLVSFQAMDGRPIAVLGNFSMHYFGDKDISADYFGLFAEGLQARLGARIPSGKPAFVGILSHGCSGDIYRVDYKIPEKQRPGPTIEAYTGGLLELAFEALEGVEHRPDAELAMRERRMVLDYRVPNRQLLEWARRVVAETGDRPAKTTAEVYAREQILLHEKQRTEVVVQGLRIGDIAIAALPTETYAVTGLKIKAASPLAKTMVIELANGGDGYVPPPEQHPFGGYNTWPARSAGLEVMAEPKFAETAIHLLEQVSGKARRPWRLSDGPAVTAVLGLRPYAYWRLDEFAGPHAADLSGRDRHAVYEPGITFYLEGARSDAYCATGDLNRSPHFVGGRLRALMPSLGETYSIAFWFWNGMPNAGRETSGWLFSRGPDHGRSEDSEYLGIGGAAANTGRLVFGTGGTAERTLVGAKEIARWEWHQVVLIRAPDSIRLYLDGQPEIDAALRSPHATSATRFLYFGGRSDNDSNWEGRLDEIAVFDRVLTEAELSALVVR